MTNAIARPRRSPRPPLLRALPLALALLTPGCASFVEVPVETPLQSKLDVSGFRRVLIAGFATDLVRHRRRRGLRDRAPAPEPAPLELEAAGAGARPAAPPGRPREGPRHPGRERAGRASQQAGAGPVQARDRPRPPGRRLLAQDRRGVPEPPHHHGQAGLRDPEPLGLPGRGAGGARPHRRTSPAWSAATATSSARAST